MKTGKMKLSALAVVVMAMVSLSTAAHAKSDDDTVIAVVNGDKILKKDVMGVIKTFPKGTVKTEDTEKVFPMVVDQMINERLITMETVKADIEKDPEFRQRMEAAHDQLVKAVYLEKYLKDKVTDKAVKSEYDKFKKENKGKQEVRARHVLVKTEDEAKQIIKDLDNGAKFADLAKERSSGPTAQNGGDVGYFAKGELVAEFSDAAFKLKPGTYTKEPVKSQFGWHVIYVEDKRDRTVPDMKDIEAAIRNKLGQDAVAQLMQGLRAKADIKRFGMDGKPLEEPKKN